jgi:hypothetical protein
MLRATCIELGRKTSIVACHLPGSVIKDFVVPNTLSQSWYLGRAVHMARKAKSSFVDAIVCFMLYHWLLLKSPLRCDARRSPLLEESRRCQSRCKQGRLHSWTMPPGISFG